MVILGLVLILLAVVLGFLAFYGLPSADHQLSWDFLGNTYSISAVSIFFIGAATMLGLLLGLWLLSSGIKRSARKSRELRTLKKNQKESARADEERRRAEQARAQQADEDLRAEHARADNARRSQARAEQALRERSREDGGSFRG